MSRKKRTLVKTMLTRWPSRLFTANEIVRTTGLSFTTVRTALHELDRTGEAVKERATRRGRHVCLWGIAITNEIIDAIIAE